jgi:lauroyl/myristoyl acyltransferase
LNGDNLSSPRQTTVPALRSAPRLATPGHIDTPTTVLLQKLLARLDLAGCRFSAPARVKGAEALSAAMAEGHGVMAVGIDSVLNPLMVRYFHEQQLQPLVVATNDPYHLPGTSTSIPSLQTRYGFMVRVRSALADGRLVMAKLDQAQSGRRSMSFETDGRAVVAADPLIRLATRWKARLCLAAIHLEEDGSLKITLELPPATSRSADADVAAFVAFQQRFITERGPSQYAADDEG